MSSYIALSYFDLVLASLFIFLNAAFSLMLQLGLQRQLLLAAFRMVVQLMMVGLVLKTVFTLASPGVTLLVAAIMVAFAGREIGARQERKLLGLWGHGIGSGAMLAAGAIVTVFALTALLQPAPWWSPQFALPLFGMILGNTMTGVSLGLDTLHTTLYRERTSIEARLLLGSSRWRAVLPASRRAGAPCAADLRRSSIRWPPPVSSLCRE